jgi:hypothetical protein
LLEVYPVLLANDGTALHQVKRMKQNIGLEFSVDLDYVNDNPFLSKETLQKLLIQEDCDICDNNQ